MALNLQEKKKIISDIKKNTNIALSVIIADYTNITVNRLYKLKKIAKEKKIIINIVKNNLLKIAIQNTQFSCLKNAIKGPTLIAYALKNPGSAARIFQEFAKENKSFKITGAVFENKLLNEEEINFLANMPTYKEAIVKLITLLKEITIGRFARLLFLLKKNKEQTIE
ncbi:50S ribosomal protein L10 [Buchnera aphidicola (Mollitrichosiphum nigrofasciatum)]|uniref:50S ribosomal protein L10 n=1 Tax=Buchnera aphidicola TaxID=9 RepID=UPI0031B813AF